MTKTSHPLGQMPEKPQKKKGEGILQTNRDPKSLFKRLPPHLWHIHLKIHYQENTLVRRFQKERTCYLLEPFQNTFQVFVSPEEIRKGPFHRIQVGQGLLLLHGQLLEAFLRGHACPLFIFCEGQSKAMAYSINTRLAAASRELLKQYSQWWDPAVDITEFPLPRMHILVGEVCGGKRWGKPSRPRGGDSFFIQGGLTQERPELKSQRMEGRSSLGEEYSTQRRGRAVAKATCWEGIT